MPNKRLLFISTGILLVTTLIVGMFGVVPLPEYDSFTENSNFEIPFSQIEAVFPPRALN